MRQETIYEILRKHRNESSGNWKDDLKKELHGSIVLTDYNNKTYKVDDVDFNSSPMTTFQRRGVDINFVDYYKQQYNITIRDPNQPLLVSNPKPADIRAGRTTVVSLIPELCRATGLTDKMRTNFQMMKAMAEHTQMDPERRKNRLEGLTKRLYETDASREKMQSFNTEIDRQLLTFQGRALQQEVILYGKGAT